MPASDARVSSRSADSQIDIKCKSVPFFVFLLVALDVRAICKQHIYLLLNSAVQVNCMGYWYSR